jgi:hypothetical protein
VASTSTTDTSSKALTASNVIYNKPSTDFWKRNKLFIQTRIGNKNKKSNISSRR